MFGLQFPPRIPFSPTHAHFSSKQSWHRYWVYGCVLLLLFLGMALSPYQENPLVAHAQSGTATVTCRLEPNPGFMGSATNLLIEVLGVDDLYGYQLKLNYDSNQVEVLDDDDQKEGVNLTLETIGTADSDFVLINQADSGVIEIVATQTGQVPGFDGDVILARGRVRGWIKGNVTFQFGEVILANGSPNPIPSQAVNCSGEFVPAVFLPVVTRNFGE